MQYENYLHEVENKLLLASKTGKGTKYKDLQKYIGTSYFVTGLTIPEQRKLFKEGYSFSSLNMHEQFSVWNYIWFNSTMHDALTQCIFFCNIYKKKIDAKIFWDKLSTWTKRIDNWAHSDGLTKYYAEILEVEADIVYPQLQQWNISENAWERRQSVLSLLEYARFRGKILPFNTIICLVENVLNDDNYFVQKGVGWCLRETYRVYPKETFRFMKMHSHSITSIAFASASEQLNLHEKKELLELRKKKK